MPGAFSRALAGPRPLVLDAAIGTRLIALGLEISCDDAVLWNLLHPDLIRDLHARDVAAGADAVVANTFGANRPRLSAFGRQREVVTICRAAVGLAREAAGPGRLVLGSIGPYPSLLGEPWGYAETAVALVDAGVDALIVETHTYEQARVALSWLGDAGVPLIACLYEWPDDLGAVEALVEAGAVALGLNCTIGLDRLVDAIEPLQGAKLPLVARPSAGRSTDDLDSPKAFGAIVEPLVASGVRLIGGCCGTTEAHIAAMRAEVDRLS